MKNRLRPTCATRPGAERPALMVPLCILIVIALPGCASTRGRFLIGSLAGGAVAAPIAVGLSPNKESVLFNALVFGLGGALAGAFTGVLSGPDVHLESGLSSTNLRAREALHAPAQDSNAYLEGRVIPPVIETFRQEGLISEDGVLHEPHRAYRIARPAELVPAPTPVEPKKSERKAP
jgi:hypothetical protein